MVSSDHDSNFSVRPSVLEVCLQLGALDSNNPIAHWMFNDPALSSEEGGENLKRHGSRFHERISPSPGRRLDDMPAPILHEERNPFPVVRFKSGSKRHNNLEAHPEPANDVHTVRRETGFSSIRSFFSRGSLWRSGNNAGNIDARHGGRTPTNSRSPSQSKHAFKRLDASPPSARNISSPMPCAPFPVTASYDLSPLATPFPRDSHDDKDDDWERIDIRPQSVLYALQHENGLSPPRRLKKKRPGVPAEQSPTTERVPSRKRHRSFSFSLPRPNMLKTRKSFPPPLSISVDPPSDNQSYPNVRTRSASTSAPSSTSIFVTPFTTPRATINAASEPPHTPQLTYRPSMGYHNQFFVRDSSQTSSTRLTPPLPSSPSPPRGRRVSLPQSRRHPTPPL